MSAATNAVLYYHPDAYRSDRVQVKGRHAAGAGFLDGFIRHSGVEQFYALVSKQHREDFGRHLRALDSRKRPLKALSPASPELADIGTLHLPGPGLAERTWQRRVQGDGHFSICGLTHTLSSERVIKSLQDNLVAPTCEWDALICTSIAAREVVLRIQEGHQAYLEERFGAPVQARMQLPIIPLGVDSEYFAQLASSEQGVALRQRLGIAAEDVVFLFAGRLSFHSKAHPVPMFLAAEAAQARLPYRKIHLLMAGQFYNDSIREEFSSATAACPNVSVHFVDGADDLMMASVWAAADVFISLSDNVQETFGLTPVEAMAAGLPCIVSDWNGYRDTVVEGENGMRIATTIATASAAEVLARRYALGLETYDRFIGATAMITSVDIASAAEAMLKLADSADLRMQMGAAGSVRARQHFDWAHIISRYQQLWRELAERRQSADTNSASNPMYPSPFAVFADHAGSQLHIDTQVSRLGSYQELRALRQSSLNSFADNQLFDDALLQDLWRGLPEQAQPLSAILTSYEAAMHLPLQRALLYLAKFGLVRLD